MVHLNIFPLCTYTSQVYKENESSTNLSGDAGFDFFVPENVVIPKASTIFVKLGVKIAARDKYDQPVSWMLIPRSSIAKTPLRLSNSVGLIDSGYRGEIIAAVDNIGKEDYLLSQGDRIVQAVAFDGKPITHSIVNQLDETKRGEGGFGSTG